MRFLVIVPPDTAGLAASAAMQKYVDELVASRVMLLTADLLPTQNGAKVRFGDGTATATVGPFAETKDFAALWLIDVGSKDEAIDVVKRAPFPSGTDVVLRQVFSAPVMRRPPSQSRMRR